MPWRIVLRNHGSHICDGELLGGIIFCCLRNCLFKLFTRDFFVVRIFLQLFKLFCGDLSGLDRIHIMHGMHCGFILRNIRPHSCDGSLRCWILLSSVCDGVFKLSRGVLPSHHWLNTMLEL